MRQYFIWDMKFIEKKAISSTFWGLSKIISFVLRKLKSGEIAKERPRYHRFVFIMTIFRRVYLGCYGEEDCLKPSLGHYGE